MGIYKLRWRFSRPSPLDVTCPGLVSVRMDTGRDVSRQLFKFWSIRSFVYLYDDSVMPVSRRRFKGDLCEDRFRLQAHVNCYVRFSEKVRQRYRPRRQARCKLEEILSLPLLFKDRGVSVGTAYGRSN